MYMFALIVISCDEITVVASFDLCKTRGLSSNSSLLIRQLLQVQILMDLVADRLCCRVWSSTAQ